VVRIRILPTIEGEYVSQIRNILAFVLCLVSAQCLPADDWPGPVIREVFSNDRTYFVRISPGESLGETVGFAGTRIGKRAVAEFFRVQADRGYRLEQEIELLNPVAPVDFFVSNAGALITLDNWHNVGYGSVLALYRADGKLVKAYKLADLFSKSELDSFSQSVSSIWWHKGPKYIDDSQRIFYMEYREAPDYRELILKLSDGSARLCRNSPKYECRDVR